MRSVRRQGRKISREVGPLAAPSTIHRGGVAALSEAPCRPFGAAAMPGAFGMPLPLVVVAPDAETWGAPGAGVAGGDEPEPLVMSALVLVPEVAPVPPPLAPVVSVPVPVFAGPRAPARLPEASLPVAPPMVLPPWAGLGVPGPVRVAVSRCGRSWPSGVAPLTLPSLVLPPPLVLARAVLEGPMSAASRLDCLQPPNATTAALNTRHFTACEATGRVGRQAWTERGYASIKTPLKSNMVDRASSSVLGLGKFAARFRAWRQRIGHRSAGCR